MDLLHQITEAALDSQGLHVESLLSVFNEERRFSSKLELVRFAELMGAPGGAGGGRTPLEEALPVGGGGIHESAPLNSPNR